MLPSHNRLKKEADFSRVFQGGSKQRFGNLLIISLANGQEAPRIGVVISKKVDKRATERNYLRRVISETIRENITQLTPGQDSVIVVLGKSDQTRAEVSRWLKK